MSDRRPNSPEKPSSRSVDVSAEQRTKRAKLPDCFRCKVAAMSDILTIPPTHGQSGLIAYECANCGYITSDLLPPVAQQRR